MAKITIYIPEPLNEKMKKYKKSINFSEVSQRCIASEIEKKEVIEKLMAGGNELELIINRLREERLMATPDYQKIGYEMGFEWAKEAAYEQIQEVLKWDPNDPGASNIPQGETLDELAEFFDNMYREDEHLDYDDWMCGRNNTLNDQYICGWSDGVNALWGEIRDRVK